MSTFEIGLAKFIKGAEDKAEKAVAKVIVQAYQGITTKTPVDTGRARNNWNISPLNPDLRTQEDGFEGHEVNELKEASGAATVALKVGGDIYISNNLPYIRRLEYGHSQQSQAMVRRTAEELKARYQ